MAVPVRDGADGVVAVLAISVNLARHSESEVKQKLLPRLIDIAQEIQLKSY